MQGNREVVKDVNGVSSPDTKIWGLIRERKFPKEPDWHFEKIVTDPVAGTYLFYA